MKITSDKILLACLVQAREYTKVHLYETLDKVLLVKRILLNTI
jgi:hypothetical protein